jgi:MoxR-like ATPase
MTMTYRKLETLSVELELTANLRPIADAAGKTHTIRHLFEPRDVDAVNASLAAGRPLLVRGEPGAGKSQLARAAAQSLGRAFVSKVIDARTESRDLLWTFDAVRRLADAQVLGAGGAKKETVARELDELRYVSPGPLWWAFDWQGALNPADGITLTEPPVAAGCSPDNGTVVLLDELDKADSSVPNGLLDALGHGSFEGPGRRRIECGAIPPLVVVTTNEERSLPDAFLRRCLVLQLRLPPDKDHLVEWLKQRGRAHFKPDELADSVFEKAAQLLADDRQRLSRQGLTPPGGAEYLDLLRAVARSEPDHDQQLQLLERVAQFALRKHPEDAAG